MLTAASPLQSFTKVEAWRQAVLAASAGAAAPLLALVANKADLPGPARAVSAKEHNSYVEQHDMFRWGPGAGWARGPGRGSGTAHYVKQAYAAHHQRQLPWVHSRQGSQVISHMLTHADAACSTCEYRSNAAA